MLIEEMHYDFKQKLNKVDSQRYRNLRVQEIDWKLNEAEEVFIKAIAEPRYNELLGVEINTRSINDLRTIIRERIAVPSISSFGDNKSYIATLPQDYWFMLSNDVVGSKGTCNNVSLRSNERRHDDLAEDSVFDNSNFEWREVNYRYYNEGLRFFTDGTFKIDQVYLDYLVHPPYMHYALGVQGGSYKTPSGGVLTGKQDCVLPEGTHREIVDIAVLITTGDLNMADYQIKMAKIKLND